MSIESQTPQFISQKPPSTEPSEAEKDLNEIIPILAHGLVRRIEQKGFSGKVRVRALSGDGWGVAKSPDNSTDIPNVIIYPRESLSGDKKLINARLRHEIGNLNYPIEDELNTLRGWCYENKVAPELLTSLVEATHEASVNYLEMQNSHSSNPEENFHALYEQEINTQQIADGISQSAPYKQAVDLVLLYSLSQTGLVPQEQFKLALESANPAVQEIFDKQTMSILDQTVKMAVPKKQVQLVRDFIWPKFSKLVALSGQAQSEIRDSEGSGQEEKQLDAKRSPEASARAQQAKEMQERIQKMMKKMKQKPQSKPGKKLSQQPQPEQKKESKRPQKPELSSAEKQERKEEENLLAENLKEQLQHAKEQLEKLQKPGQQPEPQKPQEKTPSMQDIGKQAEQMKRQAEKAMQEVGADEITEEQLQKLKEQLEQLEEVAKQIAESGALEEELVKPEEEPMAYNIKEYGINEADLTSEQLDHLGQIRTFAQGTSKVYRTAMRLLMKGYQQHNPNFTDSMIQKMMERSYDVPDFSIYGSGAAQEFLSNQEELGIDAFSDNFLVNFQLPRPLARLWYKGGNGSKSVPVKEGEIEWGHFYRMAMPVIYSGVDRAGMSGLYLNRLNGFGQHDPKKYYYLYEAINAKIENENSESDESDNSEDSEKGEGEKQGEEVDGGEPGEGQEQGTEASDSGSESGEGQGEGAGEGGQGGQSGEQMGGEGGGEQGRSESGSGGMPSAQEMQELLSQMQEMLNQAKEQGGQGGAPGSDQEAIDQLLEQFNQMQQSLESGGSPQDMAGQMQDAMQQLSEMMGEMQGEQGDQEGQGGQPGEMSGEGSEGSESGGESGEQSHDQFQQGGKSHEGGVEGMFSKPNEELLKQLRQAEAMVGSKFSTKDEGGNIISRDVSQSVSESLRSETSQSNQTHTRQLETLEDLKRQQQAKMEAMYKEMSGLDGEALRVYVDYMESTKDFINDLKEFFIDKFNLDKEYLRERNQRRGSRLQRGFTQNVLGQKEGRTVIDPRSFERKRPPEKPQFAWSLIIDNSDSCSGEIIEQEKKLAVALVEVAKALDIPLEIVTFGGSDQFIFLKGFEQEISGDDLQKMVLLNADQGTPDVITLDAACTSMEKFADKFKRSYNFLYFMTDGQSGEGSIQEVIKKHKNMVITGIGMVGAAQTIAQTWGKNAVEVPDVKKLSDAFIKKVEDQIDSTFD